MQIKGLHKNIYRLSQYALSQEKAADHRKKYDIPVKNGKKPKPKDVMKLFANSILESPEQPITATSRC